MELKPTFLGTMVALAAASFGVVAALAWNSAITDLVKTVFPHGQGIVYEFVYAIVISVVAIIVVRWLGKLADREPPKS